MRTRMRIAPVATIKWFLIFKCVIRKLLYSFTLVNISIPLTLTYTIYRVAN